ncbi:HDOD domain-containing protein [Candidatus Berkiella cookevillensis]|uniref:HDOD domain protein n=1 Tax=Candidatus Berkiella cookevillensis TaxID=437022 RepID=A0A0Q9YL40_9GAMM|nr:HDOD domain-containing protein [Candidatus Berkiella cookevillensis]MCS5708050.1 HDOD domain-containing protein [Candidatus Berkiella cookevillensis]
MSDLSNTFSITPESKARFRNIYEYLDGLALSYEVIEHAETRSLEQAAQLCAIPRTELLRTVILSEEHGALMAILPCNRLLDFSVLCKTLNRDLAPAQYESLQLIFKECEANSYPPLPDYFEMDAILDKSILSLEDVYFEPGNHHTLIKMTRQDFLSLLHNAWQGDFSAPIASLTEMKENSQLAAQINQFTPKRFENRLQETIELPAVPPMADKILQLRSDPNATAMNLAVIIEKDPSLAAQLIKWAQSPYYGYSGKIISVENAIIKVLGFDLVLNLALGLALNRSMKVPLDGPLGLKAYWKFSIYAATLIENLIYEMPKAMRPIRGLAYLSGLLHNFGHLVLAELFPPQHFLLNRYLEVNPEVSINEIEKHVLGVTHTQIGTWLLQNWGMPAEVLAAVKWHHEGDYSNEHAVYANLACIAGRLLKRYNMGDATEDSLPPEILGSLSMSAEQAEAALEKLLSKKDGLDSIVNQLSA